MSVNTWQTINTWVGGSGITLTATLGTIDYTSQNTTIGFTGDIDVISTLGAINYSSQDAVIGLTGDIDINPTLGTIVYGSFPVNISIGEGQLIGDVTAWFADDIYTAGFKPDTITVSFK